MSEVNKETLSAAMDGELSKEELRFLLRRLDHDASLLPVWSRYHVAGDGLRHQVSPMAGSGFAARVMQVIEDDQAAVSPTVPRRRDWLRLSVGGAIAASVAVAALMISQPTGPDPAHSGGLASSTTSPAAAKAVASVSPNNALAVVPPSLSPYSASGLSQRAAVTLGDPADNPLFQRYPILSGQVLSGQDYSTKGYKTLNDQDGSYLLLIDRPQPKAAVQARAYQGSAGH